MPCRDHVAQVAAHQAEFERRETTVFLITFAKLYWVKKWQVETGIPFPILLDPDRAAYRAFGLQHSIWRSWGWNNLRYYVRAVRQGKRFALNRGDTNQLGGDFILDGRSRIRFAYPSRDPTDRPDVRRLLAVIDELTSG
ncbi:MAG: SelL-related redox protein [Anaerolineae bacterium]